MRSRRSKPASLATTSKFMGDWNYALFFAGSSDGFAGTASAGGTAVGFLPGLVAAGGTCPEWGPGCVKTPMSNLRVGSLSRLRSITKEPLWQSPSKEEKRENNSAHFLLVHVFTQVRRETGKE